ncbi:MAG: hypothetical protein EXQ87_09630 [Alphaproteobacteria bacterium]|nr:hypothetical protein [Alphaproteobacteria bacterium]
MAGVRKNPIASPTAYAVGGLREFAKGWLGDMSNTLLRFLWQISGMTALLPLIAITLYLINSVDEYATLGMIAGAPLAASLALFLALWLRASLPATARRGNRVATLA